MTAPGHQKCYYQQKETLAGGKLDKDDTDGYGPETFTLSHLIPGRYIVRVHFFSGSAKISGTVEIITHEGTDKEKKTTHKFKLSRLNEVVTIFDAKLK